MRRQAIYRTEVALDEVYICPTSLETCAPLCDIGKELATGILNPDTYITCCNALGCCCMADSLGPLEKANAEQNKEYWALMQRKGDEAAYETRYNL